MVKNYLALFVLLTTGVVVGMLWSQPEEPVGTNVTPTALSAEQQSPAQIQRTANLEAEIIQLKQRLERLEQEVHQRGLAVPGNEESTDTLPPKDTELPAFVSRSTPLPVVDGLIKAGLDSFTAQGIARKQSEAELRQLELRDNAIREGYMGTDRFREEMRQLRNETVRVRDEIDEASYDKYLYYTGQPNRVAVGSVLLGSAAEENGIRQGDTILRYDNEPLYSARDLRTATIKGERDERVNVTVQRGDSQVTVSVPRGPLGVRLNPMSINPEQDQ
ncbi:MAG: PDZ domain-containing protein [Proteobacteria bacterium]|nr:PDZ domain-containing protein [Pseudomonadota bacterium]